MPKIELSQEEFELLLKVVREKSTRDKLERVKTSEEHGKISMVLELGDIEYLLDELTFGFTEIGIDQESEPNEIGLKIEEIIDKLARLVY